MRITVLGKSYVAGFPLDVLGPGRLKGARRMGAKTLIFRRPGDGKALKKVHGASLADLVRFSTLESDTRQYIGDRLSRELAHQLKRVKR